MINQEQLDLLRQGVEIWNQWREEHPDIRPDLFGANLSTSNLSGVNFSGAYLVGASLFGANLSTSNLSRAYLSRADLWGTDLSEANLTGADLTGATLIRTNLSRATLVDCSIYGIAVWGIRLDGTRQENLLITDYGEPAITIDNLKVAQFIHLLLNNEELREVIQTIATKVVLILGRFTPEQKAVLDALREAIRKHNLLPIMYDFQEPQKDRTETIRLLAHMARFIIADITNAKAVPVELQSIVPDLPTVPVQLIMQEGDTEYAMMDHILLFRSVIQQVYRYRDVNDLLVSLPEKVIAPAEQKAQEMATLLDQIRRRLP